ncbi:hypothetical protein N8525_03960 [Verrucomicrobiales bacterium]|nr:hypothetical protein [Verrucomicrobiales bacterium]
MEPLEAVTFPSEDNLSVTADFYPTTNRTQTPIIVLFHQANWSRGEYREIAPRLQDLRFQALAVGQRSGNAVNGATNHTAKQAKADGQCLEPALSMPSQICVQPFGMPAA